MAAVDVQMQSTEGLTEPGLSSSAEQDLYLKFKALQRTMEFLEIQVGAHLHSCAVACVRSFPRLTLSVTGVRRPALVPMSLIGCLCTVNKTGLGSRRRSHGMGHSSL